MFDVLKHATRASLRFGAMNHADVCNDVPSGFDGPVSGLTEGRTSGVAGATPRTATGLSIPSEVWAAVALTDQSLALVGGALQRGRGALHARNLAVATREMAEAMAACRSLAIVTGLVLRAVPVPGTVAAQADRMFRQLSTVADALALACRRDDWDRVEWIVGVDLPAVLGEWSALTAVVRDTLTAPGPDVTAHASDEPCTLVGLAAGVH